MTTALRNIKLPADRIAQLRQIAADMDGGTMSAALGRLLKLARDQGYVAHGIPSVAINSIGDELQIKLGEGKAVLFSLDDLQKMADTVRDFLAGNLDNGRGQIVVRMFKGGGFSILGRGNGVKIAIPIGAEPFVFTRDLAEEFADLLEYEAAKGRA